LGAAVPTAPEEKDIVTVATKAQIAEVLSRQGQARFSAEIKRMYGNRCCFPGCNVSDARFLVGAHIARWSDNERLRGHLGNGLSLCLIHDKAFEIGIFTIDESYRVFLNPREKESRSSIVLKVRLSEGEQIRLADIKPLEDALLEHWIRVGVEP
jgi:putative restriction endonuclease